MKLWHLENQSWAGNRGEVSQSSEVMELLQGGPGDAGEGVCGQGKW